jgi:hypothetical protein
MEEAEESEKDPKHLRELVLRVVEEKETAEKLVSRSPMPLVTDTNLERNKNKIYS